MDLHLNEIECRVLGCLVEKDLATPEYYPLTLNALTNACNQKSNRNPVMALEETDVVRALDSLGFKRLAHKSAEGVRAAKYCHNLEGLLKLEPTEMAVLAELLLRGPQTPGELRSRAERMHPFAGMEELQETLTVLMETDPPLALCLPRQAGHKESRYAHLLSGEPEHATEASTPVEPARLQVAAENERLAQLEEEVASLRTEVAALREALDAFRKQFE